MFYKQFPISRWAAAYLLSVASFFAVSAKNVNADEALTIANRFMGFTESRSSAPLHLEYSVTCDGSDAPAFYVFNAEGRKGFVVVAGDDAVTPILGYSTSTSFDSKDIPPALQWQLDQYREEMSRLASEIPVPLSRSASMAPIEPLITTQWGQREPFNRFTPGFDDDEHNPTGCIATALAQIMYHHRGVERPTGSHSYEYREQLFSYDYSKAAFDWANMKDIYWGTEVSDAEAEAVSELMWACGVGVDMGYKDTGSGSDIVFAKRFLVDNMGYNPEMALRYKNNYTSEEWVELLYEELVNDRPVICQGGGHAYICDGYDGEGYFHFNWGWYGLHDGYFLPSLLNPTPSDNFHRSMYVLIGIEGSLTDEIYWTPDMICQDDFKIGSDGIVRLKAANLSAKSFKGKFGFKVSDEGGENIKWCEFKTDVETGGVELMGIWVVKPSPDVRERLPENLGLEPGHYVLTPGYHAGDSIWRELRCFVGCQDHILLDVTEEGKHIYSNPPLPSPSYDVTITNLRINDYAEDEALRGVTFVGNPPSLYFTFVNHGDLACRPNFEFVFYKDEEIYDKRSMAYQLEGNQVFDFGAQFAKGFDEGDYSLDIYDDFGRKVNDQTLYFSVIPKPEPTGINAPSADTWNPDAPVEYFDLQGRRISNPGPGLYIARQGSLTRKLHLH